MSGEKRNPESIFHEARQISQAGDRASFLDDACGKDAAMRARVEKLLAADGEAGSFLQPPSASSTAPTLESRRGSDDTIPLRSSSGSAAVSEKPGTVIGRYKLLRQIGEGGFGSVFLAEQEKPVRRRVALKIIKLGMDTRQVITRFEAERQALALMDHPHVAKVLDAGATDSGRPYFVMEYVEGVPITKYCDRHELSLAERLGLFVQVCGAVQHAHQKGIIHRDIKPGNVLVAELDGEPVPKVIDFGIAKATEQKLTERTMFTEFGQFMGTPAYMSPEQADPMGLDIDTRSDVYSLGVLLYELLTGTTPFDVRTLDAASIAEIQRIIREDEPKRPSTRLTTLGDSLAEVAKQRQSDVRRIKTALRGDLDWIIMKALDKDRQRRYDTATDFARDLQRYLSHEPVSAGPPSVSYRLHKFVRRNRTGVTVGAIAAIALIAFAVTMTVQAERIASERDRANHERAVSDRVVEFQADMLQGIRPVKLGESIAADLRQRIGSALESTGAPEDQREASLAAFDAMLRGVSLTDAARNVLDVNILAPATAAVEKQFTDQPQVEARLQHALSETYRSLGLPDKALPHAERALELRREHLGANQRDTLRSLVLQAMILWDLDRNDESGVILNKAITDFEKAFGPEDRDALMAKMYIGVLDMGRGLNVQARKRFDELIETQERVFGPEDTDLATTLHNLGQTLLNLHKEAEALPILERSLKIRLKHLGPDDPRTLASMQYLAKAYQTQGRNDEAAQMLLDSMKSFERVRGERHPDTVLAVTNLAEFYKEQGKYKEAEPVARKALELSRAAWGNAHRRTFSAITNLGIILALLGRHHEAEPLFIEVYERTKEAFGPDDSSTMDRLNNLAVHYWYLGRYQKALDLFAETLEVTKRRFGEDHVETTHAMINLAVVYTKLGRLEEAQAMLDKVLAIRVKAYGAEHRQTLEARSSLANLVFEKGDHVQAERLYVELFAAQKKVLGVDHPLTLGSGYNLGLVYRRMDRDADAEPLLTDVLARRRAVVGASHDETLDTAWELTALYSKAGRLDEARSLSAEVIAARRAAASSADASPAQLGDCALILLTCVVEDLRNPSEALVLARKANEATNYEDAALLNTLARALSDTGQQSEAVDTQRKAIDRLPEGSRERADYEERLAEYAGANPSQALNRQN